MPRAAIAVRKHTFPRLRIGLAVLAAGAAAAATGATGGCAADPPGVGGGTGGRVSPGGSGGAAGPGSPLVGPGFGSTMRTGSGTSSAQYEKALVTRDGVSYFFMANGWGPGFQSQTVAWQGTSFVVQSMQGTQGAGYEPASYPTVFCGAYSDSSSGACGLPRTVASTTSLRTGWMWHANGNSGQYNAAYDIWLGNGTSTTNKTAFLMVWLRDPVGQQPAGSVVAYGVSIPNVPGTWNLWEGMVEGKPYIAYARPERQDTETLEFDAMDFVRDVRSRSLNLPGSHILSVAVGFEIWNGPVTNLSTEDFYIDVQ